LSALLLRGRALAAPLLALAAWTFPAAAAVPDHPALEVAPEPPWVEVLPVAPEPAQVAPPVASAAFEYLLVDFQARLAGPDTAEHERLVYRVVTRAGVESASQRDVSFDPAFQHLVLHHLRLYRDGRWSDRLDDALITLAQREADFSRRLYDGSLSLLLVMQDVRVGDVIDFSYTVEGFNRVFGDKTYGAVAMGWSVPVARRHCRVLSPVDRPVFFRGYAGAPDTPEPRVSGGVREWLWDLRDLEQVDTEEQVPHDYEEYPWLQYTRYSSWSEVVEWALALYRVPAAVPPALRRQAQEIARDAVEPADRALTAARWVQDDLRYFGVMLGPNSHAPHPPRQTLERLFGDCKDKTVLLIALLRELGIEAWPAFVDTGAGALLAHHLPSPGALDHVIVLAEVDGREVWIDPTVSLQGGPVDRLYVPDYRWALVVRPGERALTEIGPSQSDPGSVEVHYDYRFADGGDACEVTITSAYLGAEADDLRYSLADTTLEELQDQYVSFYSSSSAAVVTTSELEVADDRDGNRLTTVESYRLEGWWLDDGDEEVFELLPLLQSSILSTVDVAEERIAPLAVPRRLRRNESVVISTPKGWALEGVETRLEEPWFDFEASSDGGGSTLRLDYRFATGMTDVAPAELAAYNQAVEELQDAASYVITRPLAQPEPGLAAALVAFAAVLAVAVLLCVGVGWVLVRSRLL